MPDKTIVLDPANPIPFRVFDNGDGTFSLAIHDPSASGGIQRRTVQLTSPQILDLVNTPVELVPAQASGLIVPLLFIGKNEPGQTPYTSDGALVWGYGAAIDDRDGFQQSLLTLTGMSTSSTSVGYAYDPPQSGNDSMGLPDAHLKPLVIEASKAFADGDGTLDMTVVYVVV